MELLGQRAYAAHRKAIGLPGTTHRAVQLAIESKRLAKSLVTKGGKTLINPAIADKEWSGNTDSTKRPLAAAPKLPMGTKPDPQPARAVERPPAPAQGEKTEPQQENTLANARAINEAFKARLTKLLFEERQGKLVDVEKVRIEAFKTHKKIRDAFASAPDRWAVELAAMDDIAEVNNYLKTEINKILSGLSRDIYGPNLPN